MRLLLLVFVAAAAATLEFQHHNQASMESLLQRYAAQYKHMAQLYSVGQSVKGKALWVMRITSDIGTPALGRPKMKWVGNMHGNEVVGREILLNYIQYLLDNYATDARVKNLIDTTDIYIMPSMNPDGHDASSPSNCGEMIGRENGNMVDLNRNFPDQFTGDPLKALQPETKALMNWITSEHFVLSANLHGGSVVASYPFDSSKSGASVYSKSPDDDVFQKLARIYASNHAFMGNNKPPCSDYAYEVFTDGITNGAHWYNVPGGMQDWNYLHSNCFEITVELSCCKYPPASALPTEWDNNKNSLLAYTEAVHMGLAGLVRDAYTKKGIAKAVISIANRDYDVESTSLGEYWRLLVPGSYKVTVSAEGYQSQTLDVVIPALANPPVPVRQNFNLKPAPTPDALYTAAKIADFFRTTVSAHPNDASIIPVGLTVNNVAIQALALGKGWTQANDPSSGISQADMVEILSRPRVVLMAGLRGNEVGGTEILMRFVSDLLQDEQLNGVLSHVSVFVLPRVNHDGFNVSNYGDCYGEEGSLNANDADLFNDFNEGDEAQPETQAVIKFFRQVRPVLSAHLGGGSLSVVYPYQKAPRPMPDTAVPNPTADDSLFSTLANAYAKAHGSSFWPSMSNGLDCQFADPYGQFNQSDEREAVQGRLPGGVSNAFLAMSSSIVDDAWDPQLGALGDWAYDTLQALHLDVSVACCLFPSSSEFAAMYDAHAASLQQLVESAATAVRGQVKTEEGQPVAGAVVSFSVVGSNNAASHTTTTDQNGFFSRLLTANTKYQMQVSADGLPSHTQQLTTAPITAASTPLKTIRMAALAANEDSETEQSTTGSETAAPTTQSAAPTTQSIPPVMQANANAAAEQCSLLIDFQFSYQTKNDFLNDYLLQIQTAFPNISVVRNIGTASDKKTPIVGIELGADTENWNSRKTILYVGAANGNEAVGRELLRRFAVELACGYGNTAAITALLQTANVFIVPVLNPTGYASAFAQPAPRCADSTAVDTATVGQNNSANYNINANFPVDGGNYYGPLQPETEAIINVTQYRYVNLAVNVRSGMLATNYPFSSTNLGDGGVTADSAEFAALANAYVQADPDFQTPCVGQSGAQVNNSAVVNMGTSGPHDTMCDWMYQQGAYCVSTFVSCCKFPAENTLPSLWTSNQAALLAYAQQIFNGVSGNVTDSSSNAPISGADIKLDSRPQFVTSNPRGLFWRPLVPSSTPHTLNFEAVNYAAATASFTMSNSSYAINQTLVNESEEGPQAVLLVTIAGGILACSAIFFLILLVYKAIMFNFTRKKYAVLFDKTLDNVRLSQIEKDPDRQSADEELGQDFPAAETQDDEDFMFGGSSA